jgi:membrane protease YdiL (CAAX protease family)
VTTVDGQTADPERTSSSTALVVAAWGVTLLVSRLPEIVLREGFGLSVPWMPAAVVGVSGLLWLASRFLRLLRPLSGYLAIMTLLAVLLAGIGVIFESQLWRTLVPPSAQPMLILLAERVVLAVLALVLIGALLLTGTTRREAYLVAGDLNAPAGSRRGRRTLRWSVLGPLASLALLGLTAVVVAPLLPDRIDVAAAVPYVGIALLAAALNAFWEEVAYRAAPLSQLQRAISPGLGVVILAVWFGLGHYYGGIPSGPVGAIAATAIALLFGRAMIETRGLAWPLVLHFASDVAIYTVLALASVA